MENWKGIASPTLPNYLQRHVFQPNTDAISVLVPMVKQIA